MKSYLNRRKSNLLIFGCWIVYIAAYVGRLNYTASLSAIIASLGISNAEGGMVFSAFAITYGAGQFVNGLLCKYYHPKYMISGALAISALSNLLLPLCSTPILMLCVWLVNGAAQSVLWSLIILTLSREVPDNKLDTAIFAMSTTVAAGTAIAFGSSALFVALGNWRITFYAASAFLLAIAVLWLFIRTDIEHSPRVAVDSAEQKPSATVGGRAAIGTVFLLSLSVVSIAALANGFIKDGVNNWLPKFLQEAFSLPTATSIILTLLLPLSSILGSYIGRVIYRKLRNHALVCALEYGISSIMLVLILAFQNVAPLPVLMALFILIACMMASINNVVTSMFPLDNRDKISSGLLAGVLDTVCYIGSAVAGTLLGYLAQEAGWSQVFLLLLILSAAATVICLGGMLFTRKKEHQIG